MCVIVDACVASMALGRTPSSEFVPLVEWLYSSRACHGLLVYGGRLARELLRNHDVAIRLRGLKEAGRAILVDEGRIGADIEVLESSGLVRSNDHHVLALARVSGARVLCTAENTGQLGVDFGDHRIISSPRGSIYRGASRDQGHLLAHSAGCKAPPRCRRAGSARRRRGR